MLFDTPKEKTSGGGYGYEEEDGDMRNILVFAFMVSLSGCAFFTNKAKREVLQSADKELDGLIKDHNDDCSTFDQRLQVLKQKVKAEIDRLK